MDIDDEIKNELQGSGFLEEMKQNRLPDSDILTGAALDKYENTHGSLNAETVSQQADRVMKRLLEFERGIYNEREHRVYREAPVAFLQENMTLDRHHYTRLDLTTPTQTSLPSIRIFRSYSRSWRRYTKRPGISRKCSQKFCR